LLKKFYLETYGCKLNQSDSDLIKGILSNDFKEVSSPKEADFIIINSCGVLEKTERKIIKRIKSFRNKKIILAGCLPLISPEASIKIADGVLGPKNIPSIKEIANKVLLGEKVWQVSNKVIDKGDYCYFKKRKKGISAIVSIAEGCLGNCSFCITKKARGKLKSFSEEKILEEIQHLATSGFKEIQLTSQDAVLYGLDKGKLLLPDLLNKISKVKGDFKVRVGMMNPGYVNKILDNLVLSFKSEKIYKFIHLPLQSGDDWVLKRMNRGYCVDDFLRIASCFRKNFKDVLLATDIIVGYPEETEESFRKTLDLIEEVKPSIVHIFRFSKRKGTKAASLKDYPDRIKKKRSRELNNLCKKVNLEKNKEFLGKIFKVLVIEKRKNNTLIGRASSFRAVVLKRGEIGKYYKVKIVDFKENYLIGTITD